MHRDGRRQRRFVACAAAIVALAAVWLACVGDPPDAVTGDGTRGGKCLPGEKCNEGLICVDHIVCARPGDEVDGGIVREDGSTEPIGGDDASSVPDASSPESSTPRDSGTPSCPKLLRGTTMSCFSEDAAVVDCFPTYGCCLFDGCTTTCDGTFHQCFSNDHCPAGEICSSPGSLNTNGSSPACGKQYRVELTGAGTRCSHPDAGALIHFCPMVGTGEGCRPTEICTEAMMLMNGTDYVVQVCRAN